MMLKGVLRCFEVAIGLKVNFHKSQLIGYSGGFVIHLSSGVAGFVAACWLYSF